MKRTVVSLLAAAALAAGTAHAAPIDGTFNYQGRLTSGGAPITGNADVRFTLWDAAGGGSQIGISIVYFGAPVTDGLFSADLNFGVAALNGDERWLQIEVRSPAGVGSYVNLGRQEVLGAPYAIQTRGIFVDSAFNVGIGTTMPAAKVHVDADEADMIVSDNTSGVSVLLETADLGGFRSTFTITDDGGTDLTRIDQNPELAQQLYWNTSNGARTVLVGNAANSQTGLVELGGLNFQSTVALWGDGDINAGNGIDRGLLTLRSTGGGEGGEASIRNDDGSETIELLGGVTADGGTLTMFEPGGVATLSAFSNDFRGGASFYTLSEDGYEQFAVEPDFDGEGVFVELRRGNSSNGLVFDGNNGSGGSTLSLLGLGSSMSFDTAISGNDSVNLPTNAIEDTEILDEPGVAGINTSGVSMGTGSYETLASRSITVPASGYVLVLAQGDLGISHSSGTSSGYNYGVSDAPGTLPVNQDILTYFPGTLPTATYDYSASAHGLFEVAGAGTYTYYFIGQQFNGASATMFDITLTLVYFPTAYGTVTPTLLARGSGDNDHLTPPSPGLTPAEIQSEQLDAVAFDQNRRAAEAADYAQRFAELEARLEAMQREQDALRQELRRASPPSDAGGTALGAALNNNDAQSR